MQDSANNEFAHDLAQLGRVLGGDTGLEPDMQSAKTEPQMMGHLSGM